jgi:hypothetical protein
VTADSSPPLPAPGFDLPVDLDGNGVFTFSERYHFTPRWAAATGPQPPLRPASISTDGVNVDRPVTPEERPALMAYLLKL